MYLAGEGDETQIIPHLINLGHLFVRPFLDMVQSVADSAAECRRRHWLWEWGFGGICSDFFPVKRSGRRLWRGEAGKITGD